jgi:hypothetical protein
MIQGPSAEVVDVYAAHEFQVRFSFIFLSRGRRNNRDLSHTSGNISRHHRSRRLALLLRNSQAARRRGIHLRTAILHTRMRSAQGMSEQAGLSSQCLAVYGGLTDDDSYSDPSVQGPWNKLLDNICFPCGHYYEEDA